MARDRIKSRASFKSEVRTGKRESVELGEIEVPWPSSHNADSESLEPASGEEYGLVMVAGDPASFGSPILGLGATDSPAGLEIPFLVLARRSESKARAEVGVVNP